MKNIFLVAFVLFGLSVVAQVTTPRFGLSANGDQSSRMLNNAYTSVVDTAGADSTILTTTSYNNVVKVALLDSFTMKSPVVTKNFLGDNLVMIVSGTSGDKLKFTGTNWVSTGTATLSSGVNAIIRFVFNGAKWVEASRVVQ